MQATTANFCLPAQYADEINFRLSLCDTLHYQADSQALHIPYINLEGQPYQTSRNLSFERKRIYAPTQIPKAKYLSPSKAVAGNYYTPLYYPKALRTDFSKKQLKGNTLVLTEGEMKALVAQNNGINCASFAGISLYTHLEHHLEELQRLIEGFKYKSINLVLLYDADAINPYNRQGYGNKRLLAFYNSAINFLNVLKKLDPTDKKLKLFVGHINNEHKGLDDLLLGLDKAERKEAIQELSNPKARKNYKYFKLKPVPKKHQNLISQLFPALKLKEFTAKYDLLKTTPFTFIHRQQGAEQIPVQYEHNAQGVLLAKHNYYKNLSHKYDGNYQFNKYLGEIEQELIVQLRKTPRMLLCAPTGAGKTTFTKSLEKQYSRVILLVPTRAIALQQAGQAFELVIGGSRYSMNAHADSIVSTFSKLVKDNIIHEEDYSKALLVIDEAHELYQSYGYRAGECSALETLSKLFENVLMTTATPVVPFFKELGLAAIKAERADKVKLPVHLHQINQRPSKQGIYDPKQHIEQLIAYSRSKGRKAYIVFNNSEVLRWVENNQEDVVCIDARSSRNEAEHAHLFNRMLDKQRAFIGQHDVVLTTRLLETGASFYDKEVDVHILFEKNIHALKQACARFRDQSDIQYHFYAEERDWIGSNYVAPLNNLKTLQLETAKTIYDRSTTEQETSIRLHGIRSNIKTKNEQFSLVRTFYEFEEQRLNSCSTPMLLGEIDACFEIQDFSIDATPRQSSDTLDLDIRLKAEDLFHEDQRMNLPMVALAMDAALKNGHYKRYLSRFKAAFDTLEEVERPEAYINSSIKLNKPCYYHLRMALLCIDIAEQFQLDANLLLSYARKLLKGDERFDSYNSSTLETALMLRVMLQQRLKTDAVADRGKRILLQNLIELYDKTSIKRRFNLLDLQQNKYLRSFTRRELYRLLSALNCIRDLELQYVEVAEQKLLTQEQVARVELRAQHGIRYKKKVPKLILPKERILAEVSRLILAS